MLSAATDTTRADAKPHLRSVAGRVVLGACAFGPEGTGQMNGDSRRETFVDETTTGRFQAESRSPRQALIAAQVDGRDYEWWAQFKRDYFPEIPEPKSTLVIPLIDRDHRARDRLLEGFARANTAIVIIDLSEYTASLVRTFYARVGIPDEANPFEVIAQRRLPPHAAEAIFRYVRDTAIERSAVSRIEWLFQEALAHAPVILQEEHGELVDREALRALGANQQRELIARLSITFGEALDPRRQAEVLARIVQEQMRYFTTGHLAFLRLEGTLTVDRTFDRGAQPAFQMLIEAHEQMVGVLDRAYYRQFERTRAGAVKEEDSRNVLGIQVADIAAAVASREYELADGTVRQKAERVRATIGRVLLNDEWL